jgi:uncharacterized membrane protein
MATRRLVIAALLLLVGSICTPGQDNPARSGETEASRNIHRRVQWFAQGRTSSPEAAATSRYQALRQKIAMRAIRRARRPRQESSPNALAGDWVQLGPAPLISDASGVGLQDYNFVAGRATAVAIDPADSSGNTVYIGGAYGGVWKSSNAGPLSSNAGSVAWVPLTDNEATLSVGSIAIQPQISIPDPAKSVILVGTGETNGSADSYYGLGILRSADAGNTWALISNDSSPTPRSFAGLGFSKIAFSTSNPSLVVAAAATSATGITEGEENPVLVNRGIYYSADGGVSWNYSIIKDANTITDPASVTSVVYNAAANQFLAAISLHGVYSSSDGINWFRLANQPGSLTAASCPVHIASPSACPIYRGEFAIVSNRAAPSGKGEMYVWYVDANDNDGGIWMSTDAGTTWVQINETGITSCGDLLGGCGTSQGFYNLSLAAVPDGTATDLYAGAVNLYKCIISVISPNCNGTGSGTFMNLTHVYGCSSVARVHPAQHSMAFMLLNNNNQDLMYFANDGGIYRSLDGYTGLVSGDCGGSNMFDSLNANLGSMTQLVSFSESSTTSPSADILLAGAQGNGSPATVSAQSSTTWQNVDAGDGGYTAISPDNDNAWFVSNPPDSVSGVNIFECALGINCSTEDFLNNQIVSGTTVGGDAAAFNTPFILDPQDSLEMLVGTCRVWRGPSAGGSFTDLSFNFETGGTGICSGSETNLVRALAAGGAKDANGFSNVIYAGTNGTGPLSTGLPTGGHVWVSSNVGGGPATWIDQTGGINPDNFPISSIAVDSSDTSGLTAYAAIMGFHVSHVWKTMDGGASWTDFTANLPDAPANALLVDPGLTPDAGILYAGTDVGVFASSTGAANWVEVGPSPESNNPGFLPNVAVTALHIFNPGGARRLRVSTYGRGVWELAGFNLSRPMPAAVTVGTPGTTPPVTMQLTAAAFNGPVNLFCTVPAWARCAFPGGGPSLLVSISPTNPFPFILTVTTMANAPSGPFTVAVHAAAPGYTTQTQNLPVTVVGGFGFSIANDSGPQTVIAGQTATYMLNVAPSAGTFPNPVTFLCTHLPTNSNCSFSPATVPAGNGETNVTLTLTTAGTPVGTYSTIAVSGTSGLVSESAQLTLVVQSAFAFSLSNSGPSAIIAGNSAKYDITVTPSGGPFQNPVTLTFLGCPLGTTCAFDNATIAAGSGTTDVFLTIATTAYPNGTPPGPYSITVIGTSPSETSNTVVAFTVQSAPFSFSMSNSGPATIEVGSSGKYDITVTPSGSAFPNPAVLSLTGCPSATTCSLSSMLISAGSGATDVFLTVTTNSGTSPGSYKITVTGTSGAQTANTIIPFTVHSNTFSFSMNSSGPATVAAGSSGKYDITITPSTGTFPNAVALAFTGCPASATCSLDSSTVSAGSGTSDVFLTVATTAGTPMGGYSITVTGTSGAVTANTAISLSVIAFNFTMSSSGPATIAVGSSAKYDISITPSAGTFPNPVALTFTGCPAVSTCSLNTAQVAAGSGTSNVLLNVATTPPALHSEKRRPQILIYALWLSLPGILIIFAGSGIGRPRWTLRALFTLLLVTACSGCGGLSGGSAAPAPNPGTAPGVYTITVIGTSGSLTANTTISLTVH